jgi:hypothetical protein
MQVYSPLITVSDEVTMNSDSSYRCILVRTHMNDSEMQHCTVMNAAV